MAAKGHRRLTEAGYSYRISTHLMRHMAAMQRGAG